MVKGRDMIYKLYCAYSNSQTESYCTIAPRLGLSPIIDTQSWVCSNDHFILQKPIKLTSIAGVRWMISYINIPISIKPLTQIE